MSDQDISNVISFEHYRRVKLGQAYQEDALSALFKKDLRDQTDLLMWYMFHQTFNKHKLFVHTLLHQNRQLDKNPNSGFVVCFQKTKLNQHTEAIAAAVEWERREPLVIQAAGRTYREIGELMTGILCRDNFETQKSIKAFLLQTRKIIIVEGISQLKTTRREQVIYARAMIKALDDAHFDGIVPQSELVFIDTAEFLQDSWEQLGPYLQVMT